MSPDSNHNVACKVNAPSESLSLLLEEESCREQDPRLRELLCRTDTHVVFPECSQGTQHTGKLLNIKGV